MKQSIEKIPTWAFGYIFNGDMTGLTDEEVRMIDETLKSIGAELVCTPPDEEAQPYFTRYPLFGLPTEVEDCVVIIKGSHQEPFMAYIHSLEVLPSLLFNGIPSFYCFFFISLLL